MQFTLEQTRLSSNSVPSYGTSGSTHHFHTNFRGYFDQHPLMGPSSTRRRSTRNSRTTIQKKKMKQPLMKKNKEEISSAIINSTCKSPCKEASLKRSSNDMELENNICLTPKAERFKIPEIKTCPPAPKKRRIISSTSSSSSNCHSIRRSPVTFFAPPDLDLFFFLALGDIPV